MKKIVLKFIAMSLIASVIIAFTFTSSASANTDTQPKVSLQKEAIEALKELEKIKKIDFKNVKETSEKKEFTLIMDDKESQISYEKNAGELYVDGELAVTGIVIDQEAVEEPSTISPMALMSVQSTKNYVIGYNAGTGTWNNTGYLTGEFNVVTVTVAAVVGIISVILTKKPTSSALAAAAGGLISSLVEIDQYKVLWSMWSYKDAKKAFYYDSLNLFNYKGRVSANKLVNIIHYWGVV